MIFVGFLNSIVVACPGCSFQGARLRLQYPEDVFWAWLIVIAALSAIPLLALCGMRFSRRRPRPSKKRTAWMTTALTLIYIFSGSYTFAGMISARLFMPLEIILMILIGMSWNGGVIAILLIAFQICAIPLYMYVMVKIMRRFDRKLYWKSGWIWQRLESRRSLTHAGTENGNS